MMKVNSQKSMISNRKQLNVFKIYISLFTFIMLFHSCSNTISTDKKVFNYNESTGIATLDPAFAKNQSIMWAVHQLYNTLTAM